MPQTAPLSASESSPRPNLVSSLIVDPAASQKEPGAAVLAAAAAGPPIPPSEGGQQAASGEAVVGLVAPAVPRRRPRRHAPTPHGPAAPSAGDEAEADVAEAPAAVAVAVAVPAPAPAPALAPRQTEGFQFQAMPATARAPDTKLSTGVERLDALLGGGYAPGCATLLFGPPFCGKQQLQQQAIVRAARDGVPVTILLHTIGAEAMSLKLQSLDPAFAAAEATGVVRYVDVHSRALGEPTDHPHATYVEDPHDLGAILRALEQQRRGGRGPAGLLAIESVSTLLMDLGGPKAFAFLRTALGRTLTSGGVGLLCLEGGMHTESEVQMAKHLCAGMVEMRKKGEAYCLHVEGLETAFARPGWIEYEFTPRSFKVTGSFASRTIR